MARKDIEAGNAFVRLALQDNAFIKGLAKNSERLKAFGSGMAKVGAGITAVGSAMFAPIAAGISVFLEVGDAMDKMRQRTGLSVEAISELSHAAGQSGTNLETVEKAVMKMQKALGGTLSKSAEDALAELGLNAEHLQSLAPEDQFTQIAEAIGRVEDPTKRAGLAMEVFGKSGTQLLPMIEDLEKLRQEARDLGFVMSGEAAADSVKFGDQLANLWKTVKFGSIALGEAVVPALMEYAAIVQKILTVGLKWIQDNKELVRTVATVAAVIAGVGMGITALGLGIAGAGIVLGGLVSGLAALGTVLGVVLSPLGLITGLLVGGIYLWTQYTETGQKTVGGLVSLFGDLWATAQETFGGIYDALAAGELALAGQIAMAGLRLAMLQGLEALSSSFGGLFGDFIGSIGMNLLDGDLGSMWSTVLSGLSYMTADFVNGAMDLWAKLKNFVLDISIDMWTGLKSLFVEGGRTLFNSLITLGEFYLKLQAMMGRDTTDAQNLAQMLRTANNYAADQELIKNVWDGDRSHTAADKATAAEIADNAAARDAKREEFRNRTRGGASGVSDAVAAAQAELDSATAQAAAAREAANKERDKQKQQATAGGDLDVAAMPGKVFSTFSATAAQLVGMGSGNPQLAEAKKQTGELKDIKQINQSTLDFIRATGATYV